MSTDEGYSRHRMDRSLDEIAAEMNSSGLNHGSSLSFGQDYEERDYVGAPIRGVSNSGGRRHAPYSTAGRRGYERERSLEREEVSNGNKVFVANLSYSTTWQSLKDHMRKAGPVLKCDVFRDSGGNSRGMGLAVYEDMKGAESALRMLANTELDGRKIYLRKDMNHRERERTGVSSYTGRGKPLPNPDATVFVGNLDYGVTWQKLKDVFKVAGKVVNADILEDHAGKSKGLGEVQFEDQADAISAIALFHGQMLSDRPMTVRMDARSSFQPDPLQLKLSTLGAAPAMTGVGAEPPSYGSRRATHVVYEQKLSPPPPRYASSRDSHSEVYSRRSGGLIGEVSRHSDYRDSRRYSPPPPPPPPPPRRESVFPASVRDSGVYRGGSGGSWQGSSSGDRRVGPPRRSGDSSEANRKLFVRNLNYSTSWQHLKDVFRGAGSVQHVDILEGPDGRSKGCATVLFDSPESARRAIDMFNDIDVDGRRLEVRYDRM